MAVTQIRIDDELYDKIKFIAKQNKRSANAQMVFILDNAIKELEKVTGKIKTDTEKLH